MIVEYSALYEASHLYLQDPRKGSEKIVELNTSEESY